MSRPRLVQSSLLFSVILGAFAPLSADAQSKAALREAYCSKLPTATEEEICLDRQLTRLDSEMNEIYAKLKKQLTTSQFKRLRGRQLEWLGRRNRCGTRISCIERRYKSRIATLERRLADASPSAKRVWLVDKFEGDIILRRATAESENIEFQATCSRRKDGVEVIFGYDTGTRREGVDIRLRMSAGPHSSTRNATTYTEDAISGARLVMNWSDPLFSGLARGSTLTYRIPRDATTNISLKGSAKPVDSFVAQCRALQNERDNQPTDELSWFLNKFDGNLLLRYGTPETDNVIFEATCTSRNNDVRVIFGYNTGQRRENADLRLRVAAGNYSATRNAKVYGTRIEEGVAGALITTDFQDPLFSGLARGSTLTYRRPGGRQARISLKGSAKPVDDFVQQCQDLQYEQAYNDGSPEDKRRWATCKELKDRKSVRARRPIRITFVNRSEATRGVMWIDYNGQPQDRGNLAPGETMTINTFRTHPWMFTDGPGNCVEMFMPRRFQRTFTLRAGNPAFGPGQD